MPKRRTHPQRNHPHHHSARARRAPFALPRISFMPIPGFPRIIYPKGWIFRPRGHTAGALSGVLGAVVLTLLLVGLFWMIAGR